MATPDVPRYLLDTSALLTLFDDEPGAEQVADLLRRSGDGSVRCKVCFISLMEIYYRVWKDDNELAGHTAYEQARSLPVEIVHESRELLEAAAAIKARHPLSLADAWIAASAQLGDAVLVHKDPEFTPLPIQQETLPFK
ncbi:PIN domain-containing protein [Endothiovibrio diazotrophicus]